MYTEPLTELRALQTAEGTFPAGSMWRANQILPKNEEGGSSGTNCIKIGLPGKPILRDYFQENKTSQRPFLLLRINFPGRPIFLQLPPDYGSGTIIDSVSVPSDIEPGQYVVSFR